MPSLIRLLRKRPVGKTIDEITTFINRELIPFLGELVESTNTNNEDTDDGITTLQSEPFITHASSATLTDERVATDSAEIDVSLSGSAITWALNLASVAFNKLVDLSALSVLGRASNTSGVMAAITATAANQVLRSNSAGTSIGWESYLPTFYDNTVSGTLNPFLLPSTIRDGDILTFVLTADTTLTAIAMSDGSAPPNGFRLNINLRDQSGGAAPGWSLTIPDDPTGATGGLGFRTPGQVQGTTPGPSYVMRSEEEGASLQYANIWRVIAGTAAQAITGAVTVAAGNGSTRTSSYSGIRDNGSLETARGFINFLNSTSVTITGTQDSGNDEIEITAQRAALSGAIVASANSNATVFAGILDNGAAENNRTNLNFVSSTSNTLVVTDDAGNDELEITVQRAALTGAISSSANANTTLFSGILDNGSSENDRTNLNFLSTTGVGGITLAVADDAGNDELEITATTLDASISPAKTAVIASGIANTFAIYSSFVAGAGGSADDVTVYNANAPFAFRILKTHVYISTAVGASSIQARSASAGGGSALSSLFAADVATESPVITTPITATTTVAANGSLFIRRSDSGIAGEFVFICLRT